jgi:hypothetical protein
MPDTLTCATMDLTCRLHSSSPDSENRATLPRVSAAASMHRTACVQGWAAHMRHDRPHMNSYKLFSCMLLVFSSLNMLLKHASKHTVQSEPAS